MGGIWWSVYENLRKDTSELSYKPEINSQTENRLLATKMERGKIN